MGGELASGVEVAHDDMEGNPRDRQPARPVLSAQQEYPTNNRDELDDEDPDICSAKRLLESEFAEVKYGSGYAHQNEQASNDCD